jgi:hypothetical protein
LLALLEFCWRKWPNLALRKYLRARAKTHQARICVI